MDASERKERGENRMATKARLTAEDLWRLGAGDGPRELVNGEIVEMMPPGGVHGEITLKVGWRLAEHVERQGGGYVVVGDVGFVLSLPHDPERVRGPDVAFISKERLPGGVLPEGFVRGAPDLAVEVVSPSDDPVEVQQKVRDYLEAGARLVWLLVPKARTATAYRPDGSARLLREGEALDGEEVLPGFRLPLAEVFE